MASMLPIQTLLNGIMIGAIYALMGIGVALIVGAMDLVNFAHGDFYMLGAFVTWYVWRLTGIDNVVLLALISFFFVASIGVIIERFAIQPLTGQAMNILLLTLGVSIFLENSVQLFAGAYPRKVGISSPVVLSAFGLNVSLDRFVAFIWSISSILALWYFLKFTKIGKALRATAQDRDAAKLMGINVNRMYMLTFGVGVGLAALAGTFLSTIVHVYPTMGISVTFKSFVVVILGGLGSTLGSFVAGFVLGIAESFGAVYISSQYRDAFGFIILLIILYIRPQGIFGETRG